MASARCPICHDIITLGVSVKLYQTLICPTCLGSVQVVSVTPMELEIADRSDRTTGRSGFRGNYRTGSKKNNHGSKKNSFSKASGGFEDLEDEFEEIDDYLLERRQRHKPERDKYRKTTE
jgi:hypothetical protein